MHVRGIKRKRMLEAGNGHRCADLYVDAHVHIYPCMSVEAMLDAAERNLLAGRAESARARAGVLLLADPEGVAGFERLATGDAGGRWRRDDANGTSVTFRREPGATITVLQGQQLISREGLEVLGTGYRGRLPSGLPLTEVVERIRGAGGLAILAWGVGKWLGRRGRVLNDLISREAGRPDVMLADNAGRPRLWRRVPQFATAAERGMRILAGTDPLPFAGEERRVGSYGFRVTVRPAAGEAPAAALQRTLQTPGVPVEIVGRQIPIRAFIDNQLRIRLKSPSGGAAS